MNFYDKMVEEGADERNVDDANYADIQTQLRNIDDAAEALDLLTGAMQEDLIGKSDSTTLFAFWNNLNKEDPPIKEDFFNVATGVPQVLANFIPTIVSGPMDQLSGADTILVERATNDFYSLYAEAIAEEAVGGDIASIPNSKRRRLAQLIVKELQEIYTSPIAIEGADLALESVAEERATIELIEQLENETGTGDSTAVPDFP